MKKLLSLFMVFVLILSGCGSKEVAQKEGDVITIYTGWSDKPDYNNNSWVKRAEEISGENLEFVMSPLEQGDSKLMLDLSSKTPYNAVKTTTSSYATLVEKGIALDLKPYLEEHGQNILKGMTQQSWDAVTDPKTGAIYGIPASGGSVVPIGATTYRKDILAKEGLTEPTTSEELKTAICTLADRGYGTPYAINWRSAAHEFTTRASFGVGWYWNLTPEDQLIYAGQNPKYKEYLDWAKGVYDCGGFGKDYETITQEEKNSRFINGESVFMEDVWWNQTSMSEAMAVNGVNYYDAVGILPPITGTDGKKHINANGSDYFEVTIIPKYMEPYAVQTIKYINTMLERSTWEDMTYGSPDQQGTMWQYCEDGVTKTPVPGLDEKQKKYYGSGVEGIGTLEEISFKDKECADKNLVKAVETGVAGVDYKANDWYLAELTKYYEYGETNVSGGALMIPSWNKQQAAVKTKIIDFVNLYITGKTTQTFDEFSAELDAKHNMKAITKDINEWYKK